MGVKELYRVEHANKGSLWYDNNANKTDQLLEILSPSSPIIGLPMPYDYRRHSKGGKWLSSTGSLEDLKGWFTLEDFSRLMYDEYYLYKIKAANFLLLENKEIIFNEDTIVEKVLLDPTEMYPEFTWK